VEKSYEELVTEAREAAEHVSVEVVHGALGSGGDVTVVDVREPYEWESGHLPGARLIPRGTLEDRSAEELPDRDRRIVVHCNAGNRGALAAKTLMEMGYTNVANLEGGLDAWRERGYEVE
jgi:phage shock protein E